MFGLGRFEFQKIVIILFQNAVGFHPTSIKENKRHELTYKIKMSLWLIVFPKLFSFDIIVNINEKTTQVLKYVLAEIIHKKS